MYMSVAHSILELSLSVLPGIKQMYYFTVAPREFKMHYSCIWNSQTGQKAANSSSPSS